MSAGKPPGYASLEQALTGVSRTAERGDVGAIGVAVD